VVVELLMRQEAMEELEELVLAKEELEETLF
jgi:hypothetical protein